jgi:hypothetical protein
VAYATLRDSGSNGTERLNALRFLGKSLGSAPASLLSEYPISSKENECSPGLNFANLDVSSISIKLADIDLSHGDFSYSEFSRVDLNNVNLKCARLDHASFHDVTLVGIDLSYRNMYAVDVTNSKGNPRNIKLVGANIVHPYVVTNDPKYPIPEYLSGIAQSFLRCERAQRSDETFDIFWDAACTISYPENSYQVCAD